MTNSALALRSASALGRSGWLARGTPVLVVAVALIAIWYVAAVLMNVRLVRDGFEREETPYTVSDLISGSLSAERPLLPWGRRQEQAVFDEDDTPCAWGPGTFCTPGRVGSARGDRGGLRKHVILDDGEPVLVV